MAHQTTGWPFFVGELVAEKKQQLGHGSRNCRKMLKSLSAVAGWGIF